MRGIACFLFLFVANSLITGCDIQSPSPLKPEQHQSAQTDLTQNKLRKSANDLGIDNPKLEQAVNPIQIKVPPKQRSDRGVLITLDGEATTTDGSQITHHLWQQVGGPTATLFTPERLNTQILVPNVESSALLRFRLSAVNEEQVVNTADTQVWVTPTEQLIQIIDLGINAVQSAYRFKILLSQSSQQTIQLSYATQDVIGADGVSYQATDGQLTFFPGQREKLVSIALLETENLPTGRFFNLHVDGHIAERPVSASAAAAHGETPTSTRTVSPPAQFKGVSSVNQSDLFTVSAPMRVQLQWEGDSDLLLEVNDPCGNQTSTHAPQTQCQQSEAVFTQSALPNGDTQQSVAWLDGVPQGTYSLKVSHLSGTPTAYTLRLFYAQDSRQYEGVLLNGDRLSVAELTLEGIPPTADTETHFTGMVTNATNAASLAGALVEVTAINDSGTYFQSLSDEQGRFDFTLPPGDYAVQVSIDGYVSSSTTYELQAEHVERRISLSPILETEFARIILQWNARPNDLDTHWVSFNTETPQHLYYSQKTMGNLANLDVDVTGGYGPETLTVNQLGNESYRYSVLNYSNRSQSNDISLGQSGATVTIVFNDGRQEVFTVPEEEGVLWNVFEIDGSTGEMNILNSLHEPSETAEFGI